MAKGIIFAESRNAHSRIFHYAQLLKEAFKDFEVIDPLCYNLLPCVGCKKCFSTGKCPLDKCVEDRGIEIKNKLISAEMIVIISPVYAHNVSSDLKLLIDRISYWLHIFQLLGIPFIIITTTGSSGESFVNDYVNKIFSYLGACRIHYETFFSIDTLDCESKKLNKVKTIIENYFKGKIELQTTPEQEEFFQALKKIYCHYPQEHIEYKYWLKHGYFKHDSLQHIYQHKRIGTELHISV